MGEKLTLKIEKREVHGKKVKNLRKAGITPGVVYGAGIEPVAVQADSRELVRVVTAAGKHTPVMLSGAKKRIAMIKDIEFDATKHGVVRHVAFHAVKADEPVEAEVPIHLTGEGESAAERAGLIVLQSLDKIAVKALPMDLPDKLEVSVLELAEAGDRVTVKDLVLPAEVEIVEHDDGSKSDDEDEEEKPTIFDLVIATVYEPSALEAANAAAAGDAESADAEDVAVEGETEAEKPAEEKAE